MGKTMKKMMALALAMVMMLAMGVTVFAQTVAYTGTDGDGATITVNNPAKGESYSVYKLFDATVSTDTPAKIAYQGTVPSSLSAFFTADAVTGYIYPTDAIADTKDDDGNILTTKMTDELKAALEAWAATQDPTATTPTGGSTGDALEFTGLPYGYYVMTTSHTTGSGDDAKAAITVTSTQPNASIYDKNINEPSAKKEVKKATYSIGDWVEYTATFDTTNYMGQGSSSQPVIEYEISDTLPAYLSDVEVTKITIDGTEYKVSGAVPQFDSKKITIPWVNETPVPTADHKYTHTYKDGAVIVVEYKGKLTSTTNLNKEDKNTVSIKPIVDDGTTTKKPWDKDWKDSAEITTYAAALKKVDGSSAGPALDGAQFTVAGLVVTETDDGVYTVVSYDPTSSTPSAKMSTKDGMLYIVGLASDVTLTVTETDAPAGYNKLNETFTLKPQVLSKQLYSTSGYEKYDADGNLVERSETSSTDFVQVTKNLNELDAGSYKVINNKGTELPSTGGIGTTIFYVIGAILVLGAGILLVTRRRMNAN